MQLKLLCNMIISLLVGRFPLINIGYDTDFWYLVVWCLSYEFVSEAVSLNHYCHILCQNSFLFDQPMSAKNQPSIQPNSSKCWQENTSTRKKPCAAWAGFAKSHGSGSVLINEQTAPFLSLLLTGERPKGLFHVKKSCHNERWIH